MDRLLREFRSHFTARNYKFAYTIECFRSLVTKPWIFLRTGGISAFLVSIKVFFQNS